MRMRHLKRTLVCFGALVFIGVAVYLVDSRLRCQAGGLNQEDAQKVANKRLELKFNQSKIIGEFTLQNVQRQEEDHSWIFTYSRVDCEVKIVIDNCGVADIGGLSKGCMPSERSNLSGVTQQ